MLTDKSNSFQERLLWDKFLLGDDKAYAYFYKRYVQDLFSYGMRFTSDRELIKDCIQDVFIKIYSNRSKLGHTDNIKLYLYVALKHTLFNVFQKDSGSYNSETIEPVYSTEYTIEDKIIEDEWEQEQINKMIRILDLLTPRQKEAIHYRYVEDMSMNDICRIMDMNSQSVQNLIQRALRKVRRVFSEKKEVQMSIKRKSGSL